MLTVNLLLGSNRSTRASRALIYAAILALPNSPAAQTVDDMISMCQTGDAYCAGYLDGVAMVMMTNCQAPIHPAIPLGVEKNVPLIGWYPATEAGVAALFLWAKSNPERTQEHYYSGITEALSKAFPCGGKM